MLDRRSLLVACCVLAAGCGRIGFVPIDAIGQSCTSGGFQYSSGTTFAAGDSCNYCTCVDGIVSCTAMTCDGEGETSECGPSGGCPAGPACGSANVCCGAREQCVEGACMCGSNPGCTGATSCASAIVAAGLCGDTCCVGTTSHCPN